MKKLKPIAYALIILLCLILNGCSSDNAISVISDAIPESITLVEVSGFYNSELDPWTLTQAGIEELCAWIPQLNLKHMTYDKGKAPNEVWNGGSYYTFNVNDGEMSFTWTYIDKAYIRYDGEWYKITNTSTPPLNLAEPGKPSKL